MESHGSCNTMSGTVWDEDVVQAMFDDWIHATDYPAGNTEFSLDYNVEESINPAECGAIENGIQEGKKTDIETLQQTVADLQSR